MMESSWASRLNERVVVERPVRDGDELGGYDVTWETLATLWAEVTPVMSSARERSVAEQLQASAGYRVRIRHRADIDATMRVIWRGHVLVIHSLHEQAEILDILTYEEGL